MEESWGKQIEDALKKSGWKCPCSLLCNDNPRYKDNLEELWVSLKAIHESSLAQEIRWWALGISSRVSFQGYYYSFFFMPVEEMPRYLNVRDPALRVIVEWRLRHGQDI